MSKIAKKPIQIPNEVDVRINGSLIFVKGPKGELQRTLPQDIEVTVEGAELKVKLKKVNADTKALWGLWAALIKNMIKGASEGFEKVLEFQGVGYKAIVKGSDLELGLGYSHPITFRAPEGINFKTEKNTITIQGVNKELVGEVAAKIRSFRKPEPYKGSGIKYQNEVIIKKAGKKAIVAG